jgi:hypothetical protein
MRQDYYVYKYLREDNTPYYFGKGTNGRAYSSRHNVNVPPKDRIIFVKENLTEEQAHQLEIELIAKYGRKDNGTGILRNLTDGGEGTSGYILSEDSKQKIRDKRALQMTTEETRKKMSESRKGKTHTEETKRKIAEGAKGRKKSPEEIAKIKAARAKQVITTKQVTCPHCGKTGGNRIMPRYHFDNCKVKKGI